MHEGVFEGEKARDQKVKVLILGESHYWGEDKKEEDKLTSKVVENYLEQYNSTIRSERDRSYRFFDYIVRTFGVDPELYRERFWNNVYFGNYIDEPCGVRDSRASKLLKIAGPRVLEHMVDTVLYFEGDRHASYRVLRGVKNRFGSTNEIGVFEMQKNGLVEVENPSEYMLSGKPENASGSVVVCAIEGTRPMLMEIQALVCRSNFGMPRRTAAGLDYNRI